MSSECWWMMVIIVHCYYSVSINNRSMILCILTLLDRHPNLIMMFWSSIFWLQMSFFSVKQQSCTIFLYTKCTLENQIWCGCKQHAKPCLYFSSTVRVKWNKLGCLVWTIYSFYFSVFDPIHICGWNILQYFINDENGALYCFASCEFNEN